MLRVIACVTHFHQPWLLLLAALVCVLTSVAAFQMFARAHARGGRLSAIWSLASGLTAGYGVWSTHFVAMTAYDVGLPIGFALSPLLMSLAISLFVQAAAFWLRRRTTATWHKVLAGVGSSLGIVSMHFVGTSGLLAPALLVWDPRMVAASIVFCVVFGVAAFIRFDASASRRHALLPGVLLVLAICALHFTAMTALTLVPLRTSSPDFGGVSRQMLGVLVGAAAFLTVVMGLVAALADAYLFNRQRMEDLLRERVKESTAALSTLAQQQSELRERAEAASIAKSQFLANMSHELRTPLNAVIGYAEIVQEELQSALMPTTSNDVGRILSAARNLLQLINEVLDISKIEAGKLDLSIEEVDAEALVQDAISMASTAYKEKQLAIVMDIPRDLGTVRTDPGKLQQCLLNLISNACKFTEQGGHVEVQVRREHVASGDILKVIVRDTGIGISPGNLSKLFQPFMQVDTLTTRKFGGTGLGLAITRKLAQLLGGDVQVKSIVGQGSQFALSVRAVFESGEHPDLSGEGSSSETGPDESRVAMVGRTALSGASS